MSNLIVYEFKWLLFFTTSFRTKMLCMLQVFQLTNFNLEFFTFMFTTMIDFHVTIQSASFIFPSVRYYISCYIAHYMFFENCYTDKGIHHYNNFFEFFWLNSFHGRLKVNFAHSRFLRLNFWNFSIQFYFPLQYMLTMQIKTTQRPFQNQSKW